MLRALSILESSLGEGLWYKTFRALDSDDCQPRADPLSGSIFNHGTQNVDLCKWHREQQGQKSPYENCRLQGMATLDASERGRLQEDVFGKPGSRCHSSGIYKHTIQLQCSSSILTLILMINSATLSLEILLELARRDGPLLQGDDWDWDHACRICSLYHSKPSGKKFDVWTLDSVDSGNVKILMSTESEQVCGQSQFPPHSTCTVSNLDGVRRPFLSVSALDHGQVTNRRCFISCLGTTSLFKSISQWSSRRNSCAVLWRKGLH